MDHSPSTSPPAAKQHDQVLDSWEDEDIEAPFTHTDQRITTKQHSNHVASDYSVHEPINSHPKQDGVRPEKTDAIAKRLIAGALGIRAPQKTEEQKAYDKATKEKETKRKKAEKEQAARAREEAERQKAAIWDN